MELGSRGMSINTFEILASCIIRKIKIPYVLSNLTQALGPFPPEGFALVVPAEYRFHHFFSWRALKN